jgi:predicted nuclease of predicted toxin-antitoxin system
MENKTDIEIWEFAKNENYTLVSFDSDFCDIANLYGHPPKIIWLRTGNLPTKRIANVLIKQSKEINAFITQEAFENLACLELK